VVSGNYIGTDVTGTKAIPNDIAGVYVEYGVSNNLIGGATPEERNLISGNKTGIVLSDQPGSQNTVIGNIIGLDASGTAALPNATGVFVLYSAFNRIGGFASGEGNNQR
jgi:hypothetical protein